jgi:hypothetical protein
MNSGGRKRIAVAVPIIGSKARRQASEYCSHDGKLSFFAESL